MFVFKLVFQKLKKDWLVITRLFFFSFFGFVVCVCVTLS